MRVLQVIHQFPPFSSQGSEMHCLQLSRALQSLGDTVGAFHISTTRPRLPRRLVRGDDAGLHTFHCVDGMEYSRVANWPNRFLQESFDATLAAFRPEVVHFHNYISLGDNLPARARAFGATVLYTLHDYGLVCPNNLLLRSDGHLCPKASPDFFQDCCPLTLRCSGNGRPPLGSVLPPLFRWRQFARNQRNPLLRSSLSSLVRVGEQLLGKPETSDIETKKAFYLQSTRDLLAQPHRLIAPSAFLRDRFIQCGVPAHRIAFERYGLPHFPRPAHQPSPDGRLRFGYIGAFHAHKGIDVLLEAFRRLGGRASLHIHGSSFGSPVSEAHFRRITADTSAGFVIHGRYQNHQLPSILANLDAIVVPSVWLENSPLTIQEAQIAGVPVLTSDVGGMAELVRHQVDGLLFRLGDASHLHHTLASLVENPAQLERFRRNAPHVPTIQEQAARIRSLYQDPGSSPAH